jgi:hypothetical protein
VIDERELPTDDVRGWFAAVDAPSPKLDIHHTLRAGRSRLRRRRTRTVVGSAALALGVLAAVPAVAVAVRGGETEPTTAGGPVASDTATPPPATPPPPSACEAKPLRPPAGLAAKGVKDPESVHVTAMDPTGRYVVGDTYGGFNASPASVLWDNGVGRIIPTTSEHATASAVNAQGVVVGEGVRGLDTPWFGWVYRDGKVTELTAPRGYREVVDVVAINPAGDILGTVTDMRYQSAVVVWPAGALDRPRVLTSPGGRAVSATGFAADGSIVGWANGQLGAYRWAPDGKPTALELPAGASGARTTAVAGDRAVGVALEGDPPSDDNTPTGVGWDLRTGAATPMALPDGIPVASYLNINAVSPGGDMVYSVRGVGVLVRDRRAVRLTGPGGGLSDPVAIDDTGKIVAGSVRTAENAGPRPVTWTC